MTSPTPQHSGNSAIVAISSNPAVRDRMIRALESCDCSTIEAQGGADILAQLDTTGFDFAVLDSKLPDLDACEVTRFIRQQNPNISYVMVDSATGKLVGAPQLANQRAQKVFEALKETETNADVVYLDSNQPVKLAAQTPERGVLVPPQDKL